MSAISSLKSRCILSLIRNHAYLNLSILPIELRTDIMDAIRDPHYGESKVAVRHYVHKDDEGVDWYGQHELVQYLHQNDPTNPILRYYKRGKKKYDRLYRASIRQGADFMLHYEGVLYDEVRDAYVVAKYNCKYQIRRDTECEGFSEKQLPSVILKRLETQGRLSEPTMVPISSIKSDKK